MGGIEEYIERLVSEVAGDLIRVYARSDQTGEHGVVFPRRRDGSLRISEQEARLLFVQHIAADREFDFSVETPTRQTYRQSGATELSARVDLTLVGQDRQPVAHIELKAHSCPLESIRKDLEKLVRERTPGGWFHTMERLRDRTLRVMMHKFRKAFEILADHLAANSNSYLIGFCVLEDEVLLSRWLRFTGELSRNLSAIETAFGERSVASGSWVVRRFGVSQTAPGPVAARDPGLLEPKRTSTGRGSREGFFVLAPGIAHNTFLHLSARGGSYRIRDFQKTGPSMPPHAFTVPGYATREALQESGVITQWLPVTAEDLLHSLDHDPAYWFQRLRQVSNDAAPR